MKENWVYRRGDLYLAIISNCVYNLGTDIHQQGNVKYEMYTLEGTDVSEV